MTNSTSGPLFVIYNVVLEPLSSFIRSGEYSSGHCAPGFSGQQDVGVNCREKLEQDGVVVLGQLLGVPDFEDVDDDHRALHSYLLLRALLLEDALLLLLPLLQQGQGGHCQIQGWEGLAQGWGQHVQVPWTVECRLGVLANEAIISVSDHSGKLFSCCWSFSFFFAI